MLIHLIRHAHAGSRRAWPGSDQQRPLSDRGEAEAALIGRALADGGVTTLWSSPFTRCVQTLEPLGCLLDVPVVTFTELAEGGRGKPALALLLAASAEGRVVAASSHGDVIPAIVEAALEAGATLDGPRSPKKGARYELSVEDGRVCHMVHVPAPTDTDTD